jgi:tetratricopeptide (TPR) repeat protein
MKGWRRASSLLLLAQASAAQSDITVLTGHVLNAKHSPVASAKVTVQQNGKDVVSGLSNSDGVYRFNLPAGSYTIKARIDALTASQSTAAVANKVITVDLLLLPNSEQPEFSDEPQFTVAGVTDNTYRGGHGSDTVLRSTEALAKATASLSNSTADADAEPHHAKAELAESSGHPLEAVKEFQTAAEINPSERNLFDWGTELLSHRAPQAAAEVFTKGSHLFPKSVRMLLGLATAWYAAGSYEKAAHSFFEATDLNPNDPNPYLFLSNVQSREITQSPGYQERLARFAKLQPGNALANYYYAASLLKDRPTSENSIAKAQKLLETSLKLNPHFASAYLDLGITYTSQNRNEEAIRAYKNALAEDPALEEARYRLSEAYRVSGDKLRSGQELDQYRQLVKQSEEKREQERRELQQFVIDLRKQ